MHNLRSFSWVALIYFGIQTISPYPLLASTDGYVTPQELRIAQSKGYVPTSSSTGNTDIHFSTTTLSSTNDRVTITISSETLKGLADAETNAVTDTKIDTPNEVPPTRQTSTSSDKIQPATDPAANPAIQILPGTANQTFSEEHFTRILDTKTQGAHDGQVITVTDTVNNWFFNWGDKSGSYKWDAADKKWNKLTNQQKQDNGTQSNPETTSGQTETPSDPFMSPDSDSGAGPDPFDPEYNKASTASPAIQTLPGTAGQKYSEDDFTKILDTKTQGAHDGQVITVTDTVNNWFFNWGDKSGSYKWDAADKKWNKLTDQQKQDNGTQLNPETTSGQTEMPSGTINPYAALGHPDQYDATRTYLKDLGNNGYSGEDAKVLDELVATVRASANHESDKQQLADLFDLKGTQRDIWMKYEILIIDNKDGFISTGIGKWTETDYQAIQTRIASLPEEHQKSIRVILNEKENQHNPGAAWTNTGSSKVIWMGDSTDIYNTTRRISHETGHLVQKDLEPKRANNFAALTHESGDNILNYESTYAMTNPLEDFACTYDIYTTNTQDFVNIAKKCSTDGDPCNDVLSRKIQQVARLFEHTNNQNQKVTYIYQLDTHGNLDRAEVALNTNGLPDFSGDITWEKM